MSGRLVLCPACSRHVRDGACPCPFCGALVPAPPPVTVVPAGPISRAALFVAGTASLTLGVTECGGKADTAPGAQSNESSNESSSESSQTTVVSSTTSSMQSVTYSSAYGVVVYTSESSTSSTQHDAGADARADGGKADGGDASPDAASPDAAPDALEGPDAPDAPDANDAQSPGDASEGANDGGEE